MSQLVRLEGKHIIQNAHCAVVTTGKTDPKDYRNKCFSLRPRWAMRQNVYYTCCTVQCRRVHVLKNKKKRCASPI